MEYVTDKGTLKQVVLFIAKCTGGEIKAQECEVNDIKWLDNKNISINKVKLNVQKETYDGRMHFH